MEREEEERQALLKTMSRTERRKERVASLKATMSGQSNNYNNNGHAYDDITTTSLVEDGVLFRPGPTAVKLRTARQMQLEVARRRQVGGGEDSQQALFASGSGDGSGGEEREGGGAREPLSSSISPHHSLTAKRRAYSSDGQAGRAGGIVLEVNRTGGGEGRRRRRSYGSRSGGGGMGHQRSENGAGRPNMIFTPSLVPVGMEAVRACPMSLSGGHASRTQMGGEAAEPSERHLPGGLDRDDQAEASRDVQTV